MKYKLYEKTVARLARAGVKDPTAQIIYLAEEIERYRAKIHGLEQRLAAVQTEDQEPLRWIDDGPGSQCPKCGFSCNDEYYLGKGNFCPDCGQRLTGLCGREDQP